MKRFALSLMSVVLVSSVFLTIFSSQPAAAVTCNYQYMADQEFGEWLDPCDSSCGTSVGSIVSSTNTDYAGREILDAASLEAINTNKPVYEAAAKVADIPWQMIAVVHLRETGLKRINPDNGQGIYQDVAKTNGPYDYTGAEVTEDEFLRQTTWAANFLKGKASDPALLAKADPGQIKDTFFGYNGRAAAYTTQATSLGFTEGYDGSPYVVNKIDAVRDPAENPDKWGQIKTDGGSIEYPANEGYGAYVIYASLAGIEPTSCSEKSGSLNEKIVQLAEQELAIWEAGTLKPGTDFKKYTYNKSGDWCAWFVSWILKEAGHPVNGTAEPYWSSVSNFLNDSEDIGFVTHQKGDGYTPKAGDFAIYGNHTHINIVTGYSDKGKLITIGGNQGSIPFTTSKVTKNNGGGYGETATYYVEVKE